MRALLLLSVPLFMQGAARRAFEPIQPELVGAGATRTNAFADFDNDGDPDLFVGFDGEPNRLYRNDAGVFTDVAAAAGVADARATRDAAWADYDGDHDPDLLVGFAPGGPPVLTLYRNDGGTFTDVTAATGLSLDSAAVQQLVWVDFDFDDDLDLFVALRDGPNRLYRNTNGRFVDEAEQLGIADRRRSAGAVWFDFDEDGDLDLYVANMDGDENGLFRNDTGRFTDVAAEAGLAGGGRVPHESANGTVRPCVGDVNNDGRLDLFMANHGRNGLFLNRGGGRFEDVSKKWGMDIDAWYDACGFSDWDNDGRLDLFVSGTATGGVIYRDHLFHNTGSRFVAATPKNIKGMHPAHGPSWAVADGDGDEDLALIGVRPDGMHQVLRNQRKGGAGRSLFVTVHDLLGRSSRFGAEVRVYEANTARVLATRFVDAGSGYNAQSVLPVHIGLRDQRPVDVVVTWPMHGERRTSRTAHVVPSGQVLVMQVP